MPAAAKASTNGAAEPSGPTPEGPPASSRPSDAPPNGADRSDDEGAPPASAQGKTQRIAKACDRCRKSKSKCEPAPADGAPCKTCAAMGAECTYTAPSFRRGPPKGYIQTLEHRLHQVESLLAAIMSSQEPRSQSIVEELSQDELAAYILESVDAGPFGRTGREKKAIDTTKDNFYASIVTEQPKAVSHRSRRQSRATRENVIESVIAADPQIHLTRPTLAWQDRLTERLSRASSVGSSATLATRSSMSPREDADGVASEPPRTKRRVAAPPPSATRSMSGRAPLSGPPVSDSRSGTADDDLADCADAFGNLSIDENREVRYHGNSAGLQLLAQAERSDGRVYKGIWQFPMAKFWPGPAPNTRVQKDEVGHMRAVEQSIRMPPVEVQDHLIKVFFTYVNPSVPVLDEESFMSQYNSYKYGIRDPEDAPHADGGVRPERPQRLSKLLLLAMFAYAASHLDPLQKITGDIEDPAAEYAKCARMIVDTVYHESRSSTVQALILLGIREFGIGSLEEGWLHIGMATRMAYDLGLNRNPDKWMHNGRELFSEKEKTVRKRIWWACCLADKFSALFLGRTIGIHEGDFSTPLIDVPPDDGEKMWQPCPPDPRCGVYAPVPANHVASLRCLSMLYVIAGEVLANIYRVSKANVLPSREIRETLHKRLSQWSLDLPEYLDYKVPSNRPCPAPQVLAMHIQYWATVLLLHRPFIPKGSDLARAGSPSLDPDPVPWESFDFCQSAACQIGSFGLLYHETYDMRWAPPYLSNCFQAAGIMHILTLRYKSLDAQASIGLQKCINVLLGMERTWTTALRVRHLIQNAKVHIDEVVAAATASSTRPPARQKRAAQVAFEHDGPTYAPPPGPPPQHTAPYLPAPVTVPSQPDTVHGYDAHSASFTGFLPGYDTWWPVLDQPQDAPAPVGPVGSSGGMRGLPSQPFTFGTQHFSQDFLQGMRDPVIHFPSVFAHHQ